MDRTELFVCQCHDVSHQMILSTLDGEKEIYGTFHLDNYGLWNRIKSAFGYIFGIERRDGDFDPMLFKPEDADRLQDIAHVLAPDVKIPQGEAYTPRVYERKSAGNIFRVTEHYRWQFQSLDILYTWTVETYECLNRQRVGNDLEVVITPTLIQRPFLARVCAGIRHIFGYRSRYGDFDSFEWTPDQATKLTATSHNIKFNAGE